MEIDYYVGVPSEYAVKLKRTTSPNTTSGKIETFSSFKLGRLDEGYEEGRGGDDERSGDARKERGTLMSLMGS